MFAPATYGSDFSIKQHHWDDHVTYKLMMMWPEMSNCLWRKSI